MINNIIFDIGGVLIDCDPRYLYRKIFTDKEEMEWFLENVCTIEWNKKQDAGRSVYEAVQELVDCFPYYKNQIQMFYTCFDQMINGPVAGMIGVVKALMMNKIEVFALSNWPAETFNIAFEKLPILRQLKGIIISGEERICKPDPKIFQLAFNKFEIKPFETVYIDDHPPNVETANLIGMKGILFKNSQQIEKVLINLGVKIPLSNNDSKNV